MPRAPIDRVATRLRTPSGAAGLPEARNRPLLTARAGVFCCEAFAHRPLPVRWTMELRGAGVPGVWSRVGVTV